MTQTACNPNLSETEVPSKRSISTQVEVSVSEDGEIQVFDLLIARGMLCKHVDVNCLFYLCLGWERWHRPRCRGRHYRNGGRSRSNGFYRLLCVYRDFCLGIFVHLFGECKAQLFASIIRRSDRVWIPLNTEDSCARASTALKIGLFAFSGSDSA